MDVGLSWVELVALYMRLEGACSPFHCVRNRPSPDAQSAGALLFPACRTVNSELLLFYE